VRTLRNLARPELLQWFGLFGAALAWTVQHVVGFGATLAHCGAGSVGANVKASAAVLGNVLFLVIIVLSSVGVLTQTPCRQA
jgi:hypothetical protein